MSRHKATPEPGSTVLGNSLTWLGGGHVDSSSSAHERSSYEVAGLVVVLDALLAWLVTTVAVAASTTVSVFAIIPFTLVVGLLVGALARSLASGRQTRLVGLIGRGVVALFIGVILGELAAIAIFSGAVDRELDQQAVERTATAPAVVQSAAALDQLRGERRNLDSNVDAARSYMNEAYVRAQCEFNPAPTCPPGITGVPGAGPETRTANEIFVDARDALALAESNRDRQASSLDTEIAQNETALSAAKAAAPSDVDRGLSGRWTAMHDYTAANVGALLLRLLTIAFFAIMTLLPLILKLWRGETTLDRHSAADEVRHRAELEADTEIALKRAAVRAEAEKLWAEQKLTSARFAAEAETAIEREQQRRRVAAVYDDQLDAPYSRNAPLPSAFDRPLAALPVGTPIADSIEAELAEESAAAAPLDYVPGREPVRNLPAVIPPAKLEPKRAEPAKPPSVGLPSFNPIPDITRAVTGIVKPFVPPVLSRTLSTANRIRTSRSVFEEFEEIKFSFSRKRTVTVDEQQPEPEPQPLYSEAPEQVAAQTSTALPRIVTHRVEQPRQDARYGIGQRSWDADPLDAGYPEDFSRSLSGRDGGRHRELVEREGPAALDEREGPRELH